MIDSIAGKKEIKDEAGASFSAGKQGSTQERSKRMGCRDITEVIGPWCSPEKIHDVTLSSWWH